ncbi:Regulatory protein RecX [Thioalkalivibrio nitratireducens DSM 14787]|uniref:Regulatory protein RecX n=1 Tax=Thioalkalivibrio nitratireducens (strain DSM 14787 / UNIQEM 213 / ALEN2) TaxID=1255043 RepID=L0DU51_THIND|nr:regulatory protein RecX [Thioalkalivibrio nitratireducens]AGA33124.1 Regulatory protein RecX [Thioalkalivibrio nitratireducens DSM 14787]
MRRPKPKPPRDDPDDAHAAGLRLLARREHGVLELARKLRQRGFTAEAADAGVERLVAEGLLSERRFAEALARHRMAQGYGESRIRAELAQHGIEAADIGHAIGELEVDWVARAMDQARRHFGLPPDTSDDRQRVLRHLLQRGFAMATAKAGLARWRENEHSSG